MANTTMTPELVDEICTRIAMGESVANICRDESMPARSTVMLWAATDRDGFSDRYEQACKARAMYWADEILDIADDASNDYMEITGKDDDAIGYKVVGEAVQRSRLRVDSRKWLLSKMLDMFADKKTVDVKSSDGSMSPRPSNSMTPQEAARSYEDMMNGDK